MKTNSDYPRFEVRDGVYGVVTKDLTHSVVDTQTIGPHPYPHQQQLVAACPSKGYADLIVKLFNWYDAGGTIE